MTFKSNPRNVQAILDWTREHNPDRVKYVAQVFSRAPIQIDIQDALRQLAEFAFEAGRKFQTEHSNWPLNEPRLYDPEVKGPEPPVTSYDTLIESLTNLPATWVPGLIRQLVDEAERKQVFLEGGLARFVANSLENARRGK